MDRSKALNILDAQYFDAESILRSIHEENAIPQDNLMGLKKVSSTGRPGRILTWPGSNMERSKVWNVKTFTIF